MQDRLPKLNLGNTGNPGNLMILLIFLLGFYFPIGSGSVLALESVDEGFPVEEEADGPFFSGEEEGGAGDSALTEEEEEPFLSEDDSQGASGEYGVEDFSQRKLSFRHRYRISAGGNKTEGIFFFFTGNDQLKEARLLNSYQQTIRIEESPTNYKFIRFSIDFTQNYDFESERFFDNYFVFNEIFQSWRSDNNQYRWGNQVFELGRVDFDSPIDVLHYQNLIKFLTFDSETIKESIPSFRYDRFGKDQRFTLYTSPIAHRTLGMRFTEFSEFADARDAGENPDKNSFLRDYVGVQYQWLEKTFDLRLGAFHWFDNSPAVSWQYVGSTGNSTTNSFENLVSSYKEKEMDANFITLEFDINYGSVGWKMDAGLFEKKNFYEYRQTEGIVDFDTVRVPHFGLATSLERSFPYFFTLVVYSYRKLFDVPAGTHVLLFENEAQPINRERDLEKHSLTGVFKWLFEGNYNATLALNQTYPYEQNTIYGILAWERPEFNSEWAFKLFHFETEIQKMTAIPIKSTQVFLSYTQKFSGG